MKINLRILFNDGRSKDITCGAADMVKFEDKFNISIATLESDIRVTHLLYLAFVNEVRTKATTANFDDWVETVESVGLAGGDPK